MLDLPRVTLLIIDCKEIERAITSLKYSSSKIKFGAVKLLTTKQLKATLENGSNTLNSQNKLEVIPIEPLTSIQAVSKFMIQEMHKYVDTDFALCTQWDAFVLNHEAWTEEFLEYDYVGAPWWFNDEKNVGNGGFSLRSKRYMEETSKLPIRNFHPEDLVLCRTYRHLLYGLQFCPESLASKFSLEGNVKYGYKWQSQFGFHDYAMTDISSWTPPSAPSNFHVFYRYCDKKTTTNLHGITKRQCLDNFLNVFGLENLTIIADNCSDPPVFSKGPTVLKTSLGNAGALKKALELALELPDEDIVYLVEDDFLHIPGSKDLIKQGLEKADYVSLYDHADKYLKGPNPYVTDLGERSNIFVTKSSHWKLTNSTVQTFAAKVKTLKEDKDILWRYNFRGETPDSFATFCDLRLQKNRTIATTIPGRSTHCHTPWESPFIDWKGLANAGNVDDRQ